MLRSLSAAVLAAVCLLTGCGQTPTEQSPTQPPTLSIVPSPTAQPTPEPTLEPTPGPTPEPVTVLVGNDTDRPVEIVIPERHPAEEGLPLSGALICIDPGHGVTPLMGKGYTEIISPLSSQRKASYVTGTQGKYGTEEALNLKVGLALRDKLETLGAAVVMTRETSQATVTNIERSNVANAAGADVTIRIHADGSASSSAHGVSVLVPAGELLGTPSIREESARLGKLMVDAVAGQTGAKNLGAIDRADLTGFNHSQVPTVLIEMGFMTNADEDAKLATEEYQTQIVDGMVSSLLDWYGAEH